MHLSEMTAEVLEGALAAPETGDTRREHALRAIARCAGIPKGRTDAESRERLDEWFENDGDKVDAAIAFQRNQGEEQPIHLGTARLAVELGIPLRALAMCCDAIGGVASADLGAASDHMKQVGVLPEGEGYRIMVPLSRDVYHDGWRLLIRKGVLPATLVTAATGRPANALVEHPVLRDGRRVVAIGDDQNGFDVFELEAPRLGSWDEMA